MTARDPFLAFALLSAAVAGAAPPAAAAGGGSITGTVTADGFGAPLADVGVSVYTVDGAFVGSDITDGAGAYGVGGLDAGTYVAFTTNSIDYIDELYDDIPCIYFCATSDGTPIEVTAGGGVVIDFALDLGGSIAGTVTEDGTGAALGDLSVLVFDGLGIFVGSDLTDAAGGYSVAGLHAGSHFVRTEDESDPYVDELYDDIPCPGQTCDATTGTPVAVTLSTTTSDIDFVLATGASISGTVVDAGTGAPLGVSVEVYAAGGAFAGQGFTDAGGGYEIAGLTVGTYYALTHNLDGYIDELYDDIPCVGSCVPTSGTPITASLGGTPGIDFALDLGGSIAGTVTDSATGAPLPSVQVRVYDGSGNVIIGSVTDGGGVYSAGRLPTGVYTARTFNAFGHLDELYDDLPCEPGCDVTAGTPIAVSLGTTTAGVDFALDAGTVVFADGFESGDLSGWSQSVP